jgi:phage head maturation protease/proteasome lid subunit RPN8/RPN11
MSDRPPREHIVRELQGNGAATLGAPAATGGLGQLFGCAVRWGDWTRIDSAVEGLFLECFSPSSLTRTVQDQGHRIKLQYGHGRDPAIGDKPIAALQRLDVGASGLDYSGELLDADYVRSILPALKAGLLGSSMRFQVVRDEYTAKPKRSDFNPDGIAERVVTEARLLEISAVVWPAYPNATAFVRSGTDEYLRQQLEPTRRELPLKVLPDGRVELGGFILRLDQTDDAPAKAAPRPRARPKPPPRRPEWPGWFSNEQLARGEHLPDGHPLKPKPVDVTSVRAEASAISSRVRYPWQSVAGDTPKKSLEDMCLFSDPRRPGYERGEKDCSPDEPKLFRQVITQPNETTVHLAADVWTRFGKLEDYRERATYLVGYRSFNTIYVTATEGDFTGERNSVRLDPDVDVLFDRHHARIKSGLSVVGCLHSHPGLGAVEPSPTDLRTWCANAEERTDKTFIGIVVSAGAEETMNQRAWDSVTRGVYVANPDGRVFYARHALEPWYKVS